MDRDELQARIRARRSGQPYRRGGAVPARPEAEPWDADPSASRPPSQEQYAPGSEDRRDEGDDTRPWGAPVPVPPGPVVPARGHAAPDVVYGEPDYADPAYQSSTAWTGVDRDIEATDARYELPSHARSPRERRRAPGAPFLIIGLVVLGAIALLGGAALAGMITRRGDVAGEVPATPSPAASVGAVATATPGPIATATASPAGSGEPGETPEFFFEDGFTAAAEPCLVQPTQPSCPAPGAVVPSGNSTVWILVVFESGKGGDLIGVEAVGPDGVPIGDASWPVPGAAGSGPTNGHAYFGFPVGGLEGGEYEVTVTRNQDPADVITFRIDG